MSRVNLNGVLRKSNAGIASWTTVPDQDADRVGVDPVVAVECRLEQDEHEDDHDVPEEGRDREGGEAVVAVQDPDHHPRDPEQDQDRKEDLRESDGEVEDLPAEARCEDRNDQGRGEHEHGGNRAEHQGDEVDQSRGEPEGLALVALLELLREDRDERSLDRRVREQGPDQVGDLEGDGERGHRPRDSEIAGSDDLADQAGHPREGGGDREEGGRAPEPARSLVEFRRDKRRRRSRRRDRHERRGVHRDRLVALLDALSLTSLVTVDRWGIRASRDRTARGEPVAPRQHQDGWRLGFACGAPSHHLGRPSPSLLYSLRRPRRGSFHGQHRVTEEADRPLRP